MGDSSRSKRCKAHCLATRNELTRSPHQESLAVRRQSNDHGAIAVALNNMGNLALDEDQYGEARAYLEEAVAL